MSQLVFDEALAAQLETLYRTRDVLRRRRLVREALQAAPGNRVLDVGCGPGFYVAELLEQVGPTARWSASTPAPVPVPGPGQAPHPGPEERRAAPGGRDRPAGGRRRLRRRPGGTGASKARKG
jgi:hypothetical protein